MRAGVVEVLALQIDFRAAAMLSETLSEVKQPPPNATLGAR